MSSYSLVVRAFNEERHIERLLEGVRHQTVRDVEVILVDSGSTYATAAQYRAKAVHIPPAEFTFGRSLNRGLAAATYDLVVIASAHIYPVYPDWLERLLEPFQDPQVALTYGKQRGNENSKFSEHQIFARWYPDQPDRHQSHPFCNNANAAARRSLWERHPYDETLTGLEDLAWAKWAFEQGHVIAYVAEAEVVQVHDEIPHGVYNRYRREAMTFKQIYPEAHFSLYDFGQYRQRFVARFEAAYFLEERLQYLLVPGGAILGHLPGLPPVTGMELEFTADVLLPAWHGSARNTRAASGQAYSIQGVTKWPTKS
jgi:glycosyltransferase involved in cell wall biosynthesis